jgi:predicted dehydrogenase
VSLDAVVVGAGLMGRWHAYEIARVGGRVVAVVDPDLERARDLAARAGDAVAVPDLDDVPAGADVVHVCTPSGTHESLVERALDGGRHVLVEKPLAADVEATERLVGSARDRGLLLGAVHQFPFQPGVGRLLRGRDRIGRLLHLVGEARSAGAEGRPADEKDRIALEILPHFLSLARRFLSASFGGAEWRASRTVPGELVVTGEAEGVGIHLLVSMGGRPPVNEWRAIGSDGSGRADLFHGHAVFEPGGTSRGWKVARPFALGGVGLAGAAGNLLGRTIRRQPAYPGLRELIGAFHGAADRGAPSPVPADEIVEVARALDRIGALCGLA